MGRQIPRGPTVAAAATAAACVTIVDGFDAFSMSLAAPAMIRDLGLPTVVLGPIFASTMGGMIIGALGGGALADTLGRLRILLIALVLFGAAALTVPLLSTVTEIVANRVIAGIGLGAAAPIAVALLNGTSDRPPSDLVVSFVWGGIAVGGVLAAGFNYLVVPGFGWRSLFVAGGVLPAVVALVAWAVFRGTEPSRADAGRAARPRLIDLFTEGRAARSLPTLAMFFFGYVTTSMIVNWLPTVLDHEGATPAMISATFAGINVGSAAGSFALGFLSSRFRSRFSLMLAWAVAGACAIAASLPGAATQLAVFAALAATLAAGSQALSVALANRLHVGRNLESTTVGLMLSGGRIGQFAALGVSGVLLAAGLPERSLFAFAGASACVAALIALFLGRTTLPAVRA